MKIIQAWSWHNRYKLIKSNQMKKQKKLIAGFALAFLFILANSFTMPTMAQVSVGVNINIPFWAPVYDHVDEVQYYYLPDIEVFYDVPNREFVYMEDGNWVYSPELP